MKSVLSIVFQAMGNWGPPFSMIGMQLNGLIQYLKISMALKSCDYLSSCVELLVNLSLEVLLQFCMYEYLW